MKRNIVLLLCLFMLTGCTINYNLKIDKEGAEETVSGTVTKEESNINSNETSLNPLYTLVNFEQNALYNIDSPYNKNIVDKGAYLEYEAKYKYINNIKDSNIINSCFEKHDIFENEDYYDVHLSGDFYCQYANEIEINITTDSVISNHNADKVEKNTYTWLLNKNKNVDISFTVFKNIETNYNNDNKSIFTPYRIITLIILIVLIIVSLLIYKKKNSEK